jgi:hypothetical protein
MEKSFKLVSYILGFAAVVMLVQSITTTKFATLREKSGVYSQDIVSIQTREKQLECLAIRRQGSSSAGYNEPRCFW